MAQIDVRAQEINAKIVYYGPSLSGKTTNLVNIHSRLPGAARGEMKSIATEAERTLFFDFVPIQPIRIGGWNIRFHLYSVPGQEVYVKTRRAILGGCDGVVFVADADPARLLANRASLEELGEHLTYFQRSDVDVPHVMQYNKVDLAGALNETELNAELNEGQWSTFSSCAINGNGVAQTLTEISRLVARAL